MSKLFLSGTAASIAAGTALLAVISFKRSMRQAPAKETPKPMRREESSQGTAPLFNAAAAYVLQRVSLELLGGLHRRASRAVRHGGSRRRDWMDGVATAALVNFLDRRVVSGRLRRDPAASLSNEARTTLYAAFSVGLAVVMHVRHRMRTSTIGSAPGGGQVAYSGNCDARGISRH